jgi:hypothetical protein
VIGDGGIEIQRLAVLADGALDLAGAEQKLGVNDVRLGRRVRLLEKRFDQYERLAVLVLLKEGASQADFELLVIGSLGQGVALLLFRIGVAGQTHERFRQVTPEREVIRSDSQGFAQGLDCLVVHGTGIRRGAGLVKEP